MKKRLLILVLMVLFLTAGVEAVKVKCYDDGSIVIKGLSKKWPISAKIYKKGAKYFEVPGDYMEIPGEKRSTFNFYSEEAIFVNKKKTKYKVKAGKYGYRVYCPVFRFSCKIINISIDYCYKRNSLFLAKFTAYNFKLDPKTVLRFEQPFKLGYQIRTAGKRTLTHSPKVVSKGFEEINMTRRKLSYGNKYIFKWGTEEGIKRLVIRYDECRRAKNNFFTSKECAEMVSCDIDRDCFGDEYCLNKTCEKLDCGECQYAEEHECKDYPCCTDEVCRTDEWCFEHNCTRLNCTKEEKPVNHTCQGIVCAEEEYLFNRTCRPLDCADEEGYFNHTCVELDCAEDEVARGHVCEELECRFYQKIYNHQCINVFKYWIKLWSKRGELE